MPLEKSRVAWNPEVCKNSKLNPGLENHTQHLILISWFYAGKRDLMWLSANSHWFFRITRKKKISFYIVQWTFFYISFFIAKESDFSDRLELRVYLTLHSEYKVEVQSKPLEMVRSKSINKEPLKLLY